MLELNAEHGTDAEARLAQQYQQKPRILALLASAVEQVQQLEVALFGLLDQHTIDSAVGAQLNVLGRLLGQPRGGLADEAYRTLLRVRYRLNIGSGRAEDILAVLVPLAPGGSTARIEAQFPAGLTVHLLGAAVTADQAATLRSYLEQARAAGVLTFLEWSPALDPATFTTEIPGDTNTANGLGDSADPTVGGQLAGLI